MPAARLRDWRAVAESERIHLTPRTAVCADSCLFSHDGRDVVSEFATTSVGAHRLRARIISFTFPRDALLEPGEVINARAMILDGLGG